jgi:hypothetical protein
LDKVSFHKFEVHARTVKLTHTAGYVPDRIKAIETRRIHIPQPELKPSPRKTRKGQSFIIHHDVDTTPNGNPSPIKPAKIQKVNADCKVSSPPIDVVSTQTSSNSLFTLISSPTIFTPPTTITSTDDLHLLISNLRLEVQTAVSRLQTATLENTALQVERESLWVKTRENDLRIAALENEKNVLLSRVKTAKAETLELKAEVRSLKEGREVTGSVMEKLERLVNEDVRCDGVVKVEDDREKMMRIGKTVVMMSQAGMLVSPAVASVRAGR